MWRIQAYDLLYCRGRVAATLMESKFQGGEQTKGSPPDLSVGLIGRTGGKGGSFMKKRMACLVLLTALLLLAGCAKAASKEGVWVAHGYLRDQCIAEIDGVRYAFIGSEENPEQRVYLAQLDQNGEKKRLVCSKEGCAHEQQGNLADPCHAYSAVTGGLMAADGKLYAGSHNGEMGVVEFDPEGGPPRTVLTAPQRISCFLVQDGWIYYAQQDQTFAEPALCAPENGYRMLRRRLNDDGAEPETVYERGGVVGYIACAQCIGDKLVLTEVYLEDEDAQDASMNLLRMNLDGSGGELLAASAGGHFAAQVESGLAITRKNEDGSWTAELLDTAGAKKAELDRSQDRMMVCGQMNTVLVDSGAQLAPRTLRVYSAAGEKLGECALEKQYSPLLGMDERYAYYWDGGKLISVDWKKLIP